MADETQKDHGEDLVAKAQAQARAAELQAQNDELIAFEQELKKKLREQGKVLGVEFAPNTSSATMMEELKNRQASIFNEDEVNEDINAPVDVRERRRQLRMENTKLIRVQIACLNPAKADLPGEIFTVHNDLVGTVKKFVPYNEAGEAYHLPYILLKFLKRKKYLQIKDPPKGSRQPPSTKMVPEFAITVLDPLTPAELKELARAQGAAEAAEEI